VFCVCCVLSCRGPCIRLITRPEESYWVWCVWVHSWSLDNEEALAHWGCSAVVKKSGGNSLFSKEIIICN
jgi:hypothetical protein